MTGTGLGRDFVAALRDYAFEVLRVDCLWLSAATDNPCARQLHEKPDFSHEGTLRQRRKRRAGDIAELDIMSVLHPEWEAMAR